MNCPVCRSMLFCCGRTGMMYDLVSSGFSHFRSFLLIDLATGFSGVDLTGAEMMEESGVSYAVRSL